MSYTAKANTAGNSRGFRVEKKFFHDHQEFLEGDYAVDVLAPGCVLLSARKPPKSDDEEAVDPVLTAFLQYTEDQMSKHPELVSELSAASWNEAMMLTEGVEVDIDQDRLPDDFVMP